MNRLPGMNRLRLSAASRLIAVLLLTSTPAAADYASAGFKQWSFDYQGTATEVAVWYPASTDSIAIEAGPFTLNVAPAAPLPVARHPLLVISHGTGGSAIAHHPLAEALAAAGFIVAALTHPGDNYQDRSLVADARYFADRPRQLAAMLSAIGSDAQLSQLIDNDRVGAIGHSVGAYTVAALLGAEADRAGLIEHCQRVVDDPSCEYRDPTRGVSNEAAESFSLPASAQAGAINDLPVIRSAVLLAPFGRVISAASRIDESIRVLIIAAEHDEIVPARYHLERLRVVAPAAEVSEAAGAGHFSFIAPIAPRWHSQLAEVAIDPAGLERATFNQWLATKLVNWFNSSL